MIRRLSALCLLGLCAALSLSAHAQTPESGWWWNPDEPGVGYNIEIQDNYMFVAAYTYQSSGNPRTATYFTAQGLMQDRGTFQSNEVYTYQNGTCPTCQNFTPSQSVPATGTLRPLRIVFDTETTGRLTWGSASNMYIERFDFYLSRETSGNAQISPKTELMLGEWQIVMDMLDFDFGGSPFYGEVLIFDSMAVNDGGGSTDFYDGCRPYDSLVGECTNEDIAANDASGFFAPESGPSNNDVNYIFVRDGSTFQDGEQAFLVFEIEVGTYQFDGYAKLCRESTLDPANGDFRVLCLDNHQAYPTIPVRGFRSASRSFVQGNDNAPSTLVPGLKSDQRAAASAPREGRFNALLAAYESAPKSSAASEPRTVSPESAALVRDAVRRIVDRSGPALTD